MKAGRVKGKSVHRYFYVLCSRKSNFTSSFVGLEAGNSERDTSINSSIGSNLDKNQSRLFPMIQLEVKQLRRRERKLV